MAVAHNVIRFGTGRTSVPVQARHLGPSLLSSLAAMWRAMTTRRMLAEMDDRMLADIGISRAQAAFEADRLPWDTELR